MARNEEVLRKQLAELHDDYIYCSRTFGCKSTATVKTGNALQALQRELDELVHGQRPV
jgi:hypothetical protein